METIRVILKSGVELTFKCKYFKLIRDKLGDFIGFEFAGAVGDEPEYLDPSVIAAIVRVVPDESDCEE